MNPQSNRILYAVLPAVVLLFGPGTAAAQNTPEMREILNRLERLEQENQSLAREVHALRQEIAGLRSDPPDQAANAVTSSGTQTSASENQSQTEAQAIERTRIDELAQTKVEASQKFPIRLTGMALFNAYVNGRSNGDNDNPVIGSLYGGEATGGATLRQSTIGLLFNGPHIFADGKVSGSLYMDFFGGSTSSIGHLFRIRTAAINFDWTNTSFMAGQDKPLISPRDPDSLAQVGVSPLTGAGNPWLWQPQVRIEQRFKFDNDNGLRAQAAVFQTSNPAQTPSSATAYQTESSRPGAEARVEYWHRWGESGRLEIAGGFHFNRNHLGAYSLPSNVYSMDWFFRPIQRIEFSGMFFQGRNVPVLGALPPGFTIFPNGQAASVSSSGGWAQMHVPITSRLAWNIFGGEQVNRESDLLSGNAASNAAYFSNFMYRLAPNVILSLEGGQVRTNYFLVGNRLNDHYDVALGYLF